MWVEPACKTPIKWILPKDLLPQMSFAAKMIFLVLFPFSHAINDCIFNFLGCSFLPSILGYDCCFGINTGHCQQYRSVDQKFQTGLCAWYCIIHFLHWWYLKIYIWHIFVYTCFTLSIYVEHIFLMRELALKESCQRFELKKIQIRMHLLLQIFFFFSTNTDEPCTTNMFLLLWVDRYSAANIICLLQDAKCIYSNRPTLSRTHDIIKISKHLDTFQGFQQMYLLNLQH